MPEHRETPADIIAKYGRQDARNMPEADARTFAFEMVAVAADHNRVGENHVAIGALTHAVLALATMQPGARYPLDVGAECEARWNALASLLRAERRSCKIAAKDYAEQQDFAYAGANQHSAAIYGRVLAAMGERLDDEAVDTMPELFWRVPNDQAERGAHAGSADPE